MKILFVSHSSVLKYHQQKLEILAEKFGHDITLVTPPFWYEGRSKVPLYTGSRVIKYEIGRTVMFKNRLFHFYMNAGSIFKKINPAIVHIEEDAFAASCWQFVRLAKQNNKKSVFFTWENFDRSYNPVYNYFEKYCIQNVDAAIAGNGDAKRIFSKKMFKGIIEVIPQYGINLQEFPEKSKNSGKKISELTYIGRLLPEKGVSTLINAVASVPDVRLHIAGTGPSQFVSSLKLLAGSLGISDRIEFIDFMDREKIPEFLNLMDVLILPSQTTSDWKEQFGRVLIEAFAAGVAVIGSDSGEIPNVVADAGLVFHEGNARELASKISFLVNDPDLYASCVKKGFKRVSENYTNEILAKQIDSLYKRIAG